MEIWNVLWILFVAFLSGLVLFYAAIFIVEKGMKKKVLIHSIFKEFGQKMWMTTGLGVVFCCLYLITAILGSFFNDPKSRLDLFFLVYEHPVVFVYIGLFIFACFSIGVYLVRIFIKHLYNTRKY